MCLAMEAIKEKWAIKGFLEGFVESYTETYCKVANIPIIEDKALLYKRIGLTKAYLVQEITKVYDLHYHTAEYYVDMFWPYE